MFLVRHGETAWNQEFRYQGITDVPLNAKGREQALQVAQRLKKEPVQAVYSSDLSRARETAEIIADFLGVPLYLHQGLREVNYGSWEGLRLEEINLLFPGSRELWLSDPWRNPPPGGENMREVQSRVFKALHEIQENHADGTVAVVTHGGIIAMLLVTLWGLEISSLSRFFSRNASITLLEFENEQIKVVYWGDTSHLDAENSS